MRLFEIEDQASVTQWARETFGRPKSSWALWERCLIEVEEAEDVLREWAVGHTNYAELGPELADVLIVLYQVASQLGLNLNDEVAKKMKINRERKWSINDDGTGQHV